MPYLLESNENLLNENNFIGRLTFGNIGLDLLESDDPMAIKYIQVCISIFEDIPNGSKNQTDKLKKKGNLNGTNSRLFSILSDRPPEKAEELKKKLSELETLMHKVNQKKNKSNILKAKRLIEVILKEM